MATLARLRRAFLRAERARVDAAYVYAEALRYYRRLRSARTRADVYPLVQRAYREAVQATSTRERAAIRLQAIELRRTIRPRVLAAGLLPAGTEFELTATTKGGTPRHAYLAQRQRYRDSAAGQKVIRAYRRAQRARRRGMT